MGANHGRCMGEALGTLGVPIGQLRVSTVKMFQVAMSRLLDGIHEVVSRIHALWWIMSLACCTPNSFHLFSCVSHLRIQGGSGKTWGFLDSVPCVVREPGCSHSMLSLLLRRLWECFLALSYTALRRGDWDRVELFLLGGTALRERWWGKVELFFLLSSMHIALDVLLQWCAGTSSLDCRTFTKVLLSVDGYQNQCSWGTDSRKLLFHHFVDVARSFVHL